MFVRTLTGKTIVVRTCLNEAVESFKGKLAVKVGVPSSEQRLVCGGKQLVSERTLHECGVQAESTVHLLLRLRGGVSRVDLAEPQSAPVVFAPVGKTSKVQRWSLQEAFACVPKAPLLPGWEESERVLAQLSLCVCGKPLPPLVDLMVEEVPWLFASEEQGVFEEQQEEEEEEEEEQQQSVASGVQFFDYVNGLSSGCGSFRSLLNKDVVRAPARTAHVEEDCDVMACLLYTSPSPRDGLLSRMPSSA